MQITNIELIKPTNLIRYMLLFIVLISFCTLTLDETNVNTNETISYKKILSEDLNVLKDIDFFNYLSLTIEFEKNVIIEKKSLEDFKKTLIYKLVFEINSMVITSNFKNVPIKEINKILDILLNQINNFLEIDSTENDLKMTILSILEIYINFESERKNYNDYNSLIFFLTNRKNLDFFLINLSENEKLKKVIFNIIASYKLQINKKISLDYETIILKNLFDNPVLEIIKNNDSCKKVFFQIIDCFFKHFVLILNTGNLTFRINDVIKCFLDKFFKNPFYLKNLDNKEILLNILKKIEDVKLDNNVNELDVLFLDIKKLYSQDILINSEDNDDENICKVIKIIEKKIKDFIIKINSKNDNILQKIYYLLYFFIDSTLNFEKGQFNNQNLINLIKNSLDKYINMITESNFEDYKLNSKEINVYLKKVILLFYYNIDFERFNSKNKLNDIIMKVLEQSSKKIENQKLLENNNLKIKDKNLIKFVFEYELININEEKTRNLLLEFLENYKNNIIKSITNVKNIELFIILTFNIVNLANKLDEVQSSKNNFLEKINILIFEREIQEFIDNKDFTKLKKLFIVKFINVIKESEYKILENLEKLYKENFKNFMINFIDNFKKLDKFYNTKNNNHSEFKRTVYKDFMEIFYFEIEKESYEDIKNNIPRIYWSENIIREEIIAYLDLNILVPFGIKKEKTIKKNFFYTRSFNFLMSCFMRR